MRKIFAALLVIMTFYGVQSAFAQTGRNNNSDWKVPVPAPTLPQGSSAGASISVTAAAVIPAAPAVPVILSLPTGFTAPLGGLTTTGLIPPSPPIPTLPTVPTPAAVAAVGISAPLISLPALPLLPPIPPIPPTPTLRLVAPVGAVQTQTGSEKEK